MSMSRDGRRDVGGLDCRPIHLSYGADEVTAVVRWRAQVAGGTTVTITGTGLANATAVKFGSLTAVIQSSSATQLVVTSPASPDQDWRITVTTAAGTSAVSAAEPNSPTPRYPW